MPSNDCPEVDLLQSKITIILILIHFVLTVFGWVCLGFKTIKGYIEYEKEIFTWYWIFSATIMAGGFHYIFYVIYNLLKKCCGFEEYGKSSSQQDEDSLESQVSRETTSKSNAITPRQPKNDKSLLEYCSSVILKVILRF